MFCARPSHKESGSSTTSLIAVTKLYTEQEHKHEQQQQHEREQRTASKNRSEHEKTNKNMKQEGKHVGIYHHLAYRSDDTGVHLIGFPQQGGHTSPWHTTALLCTKQRTTSRTRRRECRRSSASVFIAVINPSTERTNTNNIQIIKQQQQISEKMDKTSTKTYNEALSWV